MPYLIAKLAYGLRCRLRDLATPLERYHLQTAAGNPSICPPIQTVETINEQISLRHENSNTVLKGGFIDSDHIPLNKDTLVCGTDPIFYKTSSQDLASPILNHLLIRHKKIIFLFCDFSNHFLRTLKLFNPCTTHVDIALLAKQNPSGFCFADVMTTFPMIEILQISCDQDVPKTWATDLIPFGGRLSCLDISMCDNVLVDTTCDDIVAFFKVQKPGFYLKISKHAAPKEYFRKLSKELEEHLPHMNDCKAQFKAFVECVSDHSRVWT